MSSKAAGDAGSSIRRVGRSEITGIVLAGGQGRRFGGGKAMARVGGQALLDRAAGVLSTFCTEVIVAGGSGGQTTKVTNTVRHVYDTFELQGPLVGIYSGLQASRTDINVVVACDMPFLNPDLLQELAGLSGKYDIVVPVVAGKAQPTHAVYRLRCADAIRAALGQGISSPLQFLKRVRTLFVPEGKIAVLDPHFLSFCDVDTQADLEKAEQTALALGKGGLLK